MLGRYLPAFPFVDTAEQTSRDGVVQYRYRDDGLSSRDLCAMYALMGILAGQLNTRTLAEIDFMLCATSAYYLADAMDRASGST